MRLVRHLADLPFAALEGGSVVTIGAFDGIHLGHRQLLRRVVDVAMGGVGLEIECELHIQEVVQLSVELDMEAPVVASSQLQS